MSANAVQKAIYQRLSAALSVPVYDHIPQGAAFPYVVIGADTAIPWDTKSSAGQEYTLTVHCWDALKAGRKSVKAVMDAIHAALHRQEALIPVEGASLTEIVQEYAESFQETGYEGDSDHYYHGVQRFRAMVEDI